MKVDLTKKEIKEIYEYYKEELEDSLFNKAGYNKLCKSIVEKLEKVQSK